MEAQASLGNLKARGLGIEKNLTEGIEMLLSGAESFCVEALLYLAAIAEEGLSGEVDLRRAFRSLDLAANLSHEEATNYPVEEDTRAADRRDAFLRRNLAKVVEIWHEFGEKKTPPEAPRMMTRARELGLIDNVGEKKEAQEGDIVPPEL
jgi:TPR repeat protein